MHWLAATLGEKYGGVFDFRLHLHVFRYHVQPHNGVDLAKKVDLNNIFPVHIRNNSEEKTL